METNISLMFYNVLQKELFYEFRLLRMQMNQPDQHGELEGENQDLTGLRIDHGLCDAGKLKRT
jgi:hypothetical protein